MVYLLHKVQNRYSELTRKLSSKDVSETTLATLQCPYHLWFMDSHGFTFNCIESGRGKSKEISRNIVQICCHHISVISTWKCGKYSANVEKESMCVSYALYRLYTRIVIREDYSKKVCAWLYLMCNSQQGENWNDKGKLMRAKPL